MKSKNPTRINLWSRELDDLREKGLYRVMPSIAGPPGRKLLVDGREVLNFSGNNYLGLATHPAVVQAVSRYTQLYGAGSTASRLIAGNTEAHRELESEIAKWKDTESALLFGSGYQANLGIISSLMGSEDLVISDELNHASIIDGCRLSKADVKICCHLDLNQLEDLLRLKGYRRKLLVIESIFSMDGDQAPLAEIGELCTRWGALFMVDEAHATGLFGPQGQGLAAEQSVIPDIQMGTLSKAAGTSGAYVAGSRELIELLVNRARSLLYSTAAPPGVIGGALAALNIIASEEGSMRRKMLKRNVKVFQELLISRLNYPYGGSHIVPILIGDSSRTMKVSRECLEQGIFAQGIRYPTVPESRARLRLTLMSDHLLEDLEKATSVLRDVLAMTAVPDPKRQNIKQAGS
ncbi:MAG TPA: 8-amino-7-oxononanoate synthase [Desulfomonilaceae bacterium]|nr:8-amino-7-oxononanoate synthase [Desulfomonilaceae bacterium]